MGEFEYETSEEEVITYSLKRKPIERFQMTSGNFCYPSFSEEESEEEVIVSRRRNNLQHKG